MKLSIKPSLRIEGVSKQFPGVKALNNVNIKAYSGEAMGLIGVNGAGKSTLMNILAGVLRSDEGKIFIEDKELNIHSPKEAEKSGIAFIHQEPVVFSAMTIAENMFISRLQSYKSVPVIDTGKMNDEAEKYLQMLGSSLNPRTRMSEIPIGDRQMVEIARALSQGAKLLLFDEPTSSLTFKEKNRLFDVINSLKQQGATIIYISHFLDEVAEICERITVLRDGQVSGSGLVGEYTREDIIRFIIGNNTEQYVPEGKRSAGEVVMKVEDLTRGKAPRNVSFELRKGEVVGLWGLMGSGRTELFRALLGLDHPEGGKIYLNQNGILKQVSANKLLKEAGYVTENRHFDGLFLQLQLWKNVSAASLGRFASKICRYLNVSKEQESSRLFIKKLKIAAPDVFIRAEQLSGGNQQKVIMSKWLQRNPGVFFLDEPTRGVDVGAKAEIHRIISELADQGAAVMVVSSEIEELMNLSDRVLVMRRGSIVAEVGHEEIAKNNLMALCVGEGE
ncbi:MAG TPA: sugar ABC transporter ATP-binding protein [Candidatus Nitrosocosmicus sp.]|nr:sugar ABC transporter ATP-binding protein [Candidatus Nitrosocosmicus sp.]